MQTGLGEKQKRWKVSLGEEDQSETQLAFLCGASRTLRFSLVVKRFVHFIF